jgi:hypothetical protein
MVFFTQLSTPAICGLFGFLVGLPLKPVNQAIKMWFEKTQIWQTMRGLS